MSNFKWRDMTYFQSRVLDSTLRFVLHCHTQVDSHSLQKGIYCYLLRKHLARLLQEDSKFLNLVLMNVSKNRCPCQMSQFKYKALLQ